YVFDFAAIFLGLQVFGFFADEFVEARAGHLAHVFAGFLLGAGEGFVELLDLVGFFFRGGADHAENFGFFGGRGGGSLDGLGSGAFGFDGFGSGAEVALDFALFALGEALAENVLIFSVGLGEIAETEALVVFEVAAALGVAFDELFNAPFDFGGRALAATAEIHVVLDLELANVA